MKKYITLVLISILFISCEEVIDVDLETAEPRLVVEATINWFATTDGSFQKIKLSTTTAYFANEIPAVTDAVVTISNTSGQVFNFIQNVIPGTYECTNFVPVVGENYTLRVVYKGEIYTSTDVLYDTPLITDVEQKNDAGFLGEETELKFFYNDFQNQTNFYFSKLENTNTLIPSFSVAEDRFTQNNEMFELYFLEDLNPGDVVKFSINGVSNNFYNYMNILLAQTGSSNGGPFSTPSSTIRGNLVNQTNFSNYALGYFRLSKTETIEYTIQ